MEIPIHACYVHYTYALIHSISGMYRYKLRKLYVKLFINDFTTNKRFARIHDLSFNY